MNVYLLILFLISFFPQFHHSFMISVEECLSMINCSVESDQLRYPRTNWNKWCVRKYPPSHASCSQRTRTRNTSLINPHLTKLDEIHRNRSKSNYNLAKNLQSWSVTSDTRTEIHTFFIWYPRVGREHNGPSGKKRCRGTCQAPNHPAPQKSA